jgi:hypothetical protein
MFTKTQNGSERLAAWRKFRQEFPRNGTAYDVVNAFSKVKIERRTIDYYTPESWPSPFEIVGEGHFCQSGLTLVIASTILNLQLIKTNECQFDVVSNHITGAAGLVFVYGDCVYNFLQDTIVTVDFYKNNSTAFSSHIITADKLGY